MEPGTSGQGEQLTPREWQVLELIAQGLTNEEIAERLQISFGTAKYHVAEIISRLGVSSREEAVVVARAGQPRTPAGALWPLAWLRSRLALPLLGAVAIAGVLLFVTFSAGLFDRDSDGNPTASEGDLAIAAADFQEGDARSPDAALTQGSDMLQSFYFEAAIESNLEGDDDVLDTIRAWYEAPDRWRFEFGASDPARALEGSTQVSDGESVWFYTRDTNTYTRQDLDAFYQGYPPEMRGMPIVPAMSLFIGPITGAREAFLNPGTGPGWTLLERGDGETIARRETEFVRLSFPGSSGEIHLWLDKEFDFVLRYAGRELGAASDSLRVEVIDLSFNEPIDPNQFTFAPPEGSLEVPVSSDSSGGSGSGYTMGNGSQEISAPEGFFSPAYLPAGYETRQIESSHDGGTSRTTRHTARLESGDGADFLTIDQQYRAGGLAESHLGGEPVDLGRTNGYATTTGTDTRLVFAIDDVVVRLSSNSLPLDELVRIAESMQ